MNAVKNVDPATVKQQIIAYYRNKLGNIDSVTSKSDEFFETYRGQNILKKAVIIPLTIHKSLYSWKLNRDINIPSTSILKNLIESNSYFLTTRADDTAEFYVLMYISKHSPNMARTGILMKKSNTKFSPVTITVNKKPFLVELKGCGCPTGYFDGIHMRGQPRSIFKFKHRITGGLELSSAKYEYNNLISNQNHYQKLNEPIQIYGFGYIPFNYNNETLGLAVRLTPSSIRASFSGEIFSKFNSSNHEKMMFSMGKEVSLQLSKEEPLYHHNLQSINMVYSSKNVYALTDWSEASGFDEGYSCLDYGATIFPLEQKFNVMTAKDLSSFYLGICKHIPKKIASQISDSTFKNYTNTNNFLLQKMVAEKVFQNRLNKSYKLNDLDDHINYIRDLMGKHYFKNDLRIWAKDYFLSYLQRQKHFISFIENLLLNTPPKLVFNALNYISNDPETNYLQNKILKKFPELYKKFNTKPITTKKEHLLCGYHLKTKFIFSTKDENWLQYNKFCLTKLITETNDFITQHKIKLPHPDDINQNEDAPFLMMLFSYIYPFYKPLCIYLNYEKIILEGCKTKKTAHHKSLIIDSLGHLVEKQELLFKNPEFYLDLLKKGNHKLLSFLALPYHNFS